MDESQGDGDKKEDYFESIVEYDKRIHDFI